MGINVPNLIVVSDLHCGCRLGLCPPGRIIKLDDGGWYVASSFQRKMWKMWEEFWNAWVPLVCRREPFAVVINGDIIDGIHHDTTTQISHNLEDQRRIAERILAPIVERCRGRFYVIRGTEAHGGKSGVNEENLAKTLGAIPDKEGRYARYELRKRVGKCLVDIMHHIGTTSSASYESTAVYKELTESFIEAARWNEEVPDVVIRSHRHRYFRVEIATAKGRAESIVTPGWQGKTPLLYRTAAKQAPPQFGGIIIRQGDEEFYARHKAWSIGRSAIE